MLLTTNWKIQPIDESSCQVQLVSMMSGDQRARVLNVPGQAITDGRAAYDNGLIMQDAFPFLSRVEREFLMTGLTQEEWDAL